MKEEQVKEPIIINGIELTDKEIQEMLNGELNFWDIFG